MSIAARFPFVAMKQLLRSLAIVSLVSLTACRDRGFVTPPPQAFGAALNSMASDGEPQFSYDGRYLVFSSDRQARQGIFLYDVQRRRLINLPGLNKPNAMQYQPDISADGRYIVYISEERGKPEVFVYDRQTFQTEPIDEVPFGQVRQPTISGNGRFIAFETNRSGHWDVQIYDRGSNVDLSLPGNTNPQAPAPSVPPEAAPAN